MEVGLHGSKVGYLGDLMYLPLDYTVSDYVLRRRGAISFGSSTVFASTPRFEVWTVIKLFRYYRTILTPIDYNHPSYW